MTDAQVERNIRMYILFKATSNPLFFGAIMITYILKMGRMTISDILFMEAVALVAIALLEVPFGILADQFGRKVVVLAGAATYLVSAALWVMIDSPTDAWIANSIWVLSFSLVSGADVSFIYDTLKEADREDEYEVIEARAASARLICFAAGSLCGGFMAELWIRLPALLSIPSLIIAGVAVSLWHEPKNVSKKMGEKWAMEKLLMSWHALKTNKRIQWAVGTYALFMCSSKLWFFSYNPYFELVGLSYKEFGLLFTLLNCIAWVFARYQKEIVEKLGERNTVILMPISYAVPLLIMGVAVVPVAAFLVCFENFVRGIKRPFFGKRINREVPKSYRSTLNSMQSSGIWLLQALSLWICSLLTAAVPLPTYLIILGCTVGIFGVVSIRKHRKIFPRQ